MTERRLQPWTPADDERLRRLAAEGRSSLTIAERMKRSLESVRHRAKKLNISLRRLEVNGDSGVVRVRINARGRPCGTSSRRKETAPAPGE
jgi:hypothetical protein